MPEWLQMPKNTYLKSLLYELVLPSQSRSANMSQVESHRPQYLKPYHTASIADPRLNMVDLTKWTTVHGDNTLLRRLLHLYLLTEISF